MEGTAAISKATRALYRLAASSLVLLFALAFNPISAFAQNQPANQSANRPAPAASPGDQLLKPEELDALVAPIALYPDTLLSQVLIASTYPLEVVQAERWANENKNLKGDALKSAVDKQGWDESIKSLVATPSVLTMMSTKLDWTQKLGDAVLAQQPDVMDAIQRLRVKADNNKKLTSTKEQKVTKTTEQGKQVIAIEPTDPNTVYVPYYDPAVVYGPWPYPAYPPYYYYPPGYVAGGILATGLAFGAGYALGRWASGGNYWGGNINWNNNNININRPRVNALGGNNWQHNPAHRQGVRYNNSKVGEKFGNANLRSGAQNRMDFRGRGGEQVLRPGSGAAGRPGAGGAGTQRPSAAQRPSGGQRPSAGQRPSGSRPSAGQRPSGSRPSAGQRPSGGGNALGNIERGNVARAQSARGHASLGGAGRVGGAGGARMGGGRGGRRSDIALKHDIVLLGHLANSIGFYRFSYNGSEQTYVGVLAQDVQRIEPEAVTRGRDGYLRVFYDKLGVKFETYQHWIAEGAVVPRGIPIPH